MQINQTIVVENLNSQNTHSKKSLPLMQINQTIVAESLNS
jgi:hypothetical protein